MKNMFLFLFYIIIETNERVNEYYMKMIYNMKTIVAV